MIGHHIHVFLEVDLQRGSTKETYEQTLQSQGFDLDNVQTQDDKVSMQIARDQVTQVAQLFAVFSKRGRRVKQSTINQHYAVLSSFYAFCIKQEWLDHNPIEHLERAKVEPYADAKALDFDDRAAMFNRFDMSREEHVPGSETF